VRGLSPARPAGRILAGRPRTKNRAGIRLIGGPGVRAVGPDRQTRGMSEPTNSEPQEHPQVVVVGPDGMAVGEAGGSEDNNDHERPVTEMVEQPAKVMRIGSMIRQLLEEVRAAPLDEQSRARLKEIHESSIKELEDGLAPELVAELDRLSLPFAEGNLPSESELRVAQAQLVGWLEGLFHGIQTTLFAQQMAARAQLEQMRRALPPGVMPSGMPPGDEPPQPPRASGPYL
jgi:hypothetical protein